MLAHIAGVPVEESLLYLAPVIVLVAWMYYAGWRERRSGTGADRLQEKKPPPSPGDQPAPAPDEPRVAGPVKTPQDD